MKVRLHKTNNYFRAKRGLLLILIFPFFIYTTAQTKKVHSNSTSALDSIHHLNEVVVTANRLSKEVIPVQILAGEQLQRLSVHSVADASIIFYL